MTLNTSPRTIGILLAAAFLTAAAPGATASCTDLSERCTYPDSGGTGQDDTVLGPVMACEEPPTSGPTGGMLWNVVWTYEAYSSITCNYVDGREDVAVDNGGDLAWSIGTGGSAFVADPAPESLLPTPGSITWGIAAEGTQAVAAANAQLGPTYQYGDDMWQATCLALYNEPACI